MKLKFTAISVVSVVAAATAIAGANAGPASAGYVSCLDMNLNPVPCPIRTTVTVHHAQGPMPPIFVGVTLVMNPAGGLSIGGNFTPGPT